MKAVGNNDVRTIRSRAGHEVTFDDAESGGSITIETDAGQRVVLDDETGSETVTVADKSDQNELTLDPNTGEVSIAAAGTLAIEPANIELTGQGSVSIESNGMITSRSRPGTGTNRGTC